MKIKKSFINIFLLIFVLFSMISLNSCQKDSTSILSIQSTEKNETSENLIGGIFSSILHPVTTYKNHLEDKEQQTEIKKNETAKVLQEKEIELTQLESDYTCYKMCIASNDDDLLKLQIQYLDQDGNDFGLEHEYVLQGSDPHLDFWQIGISQDKFVLVPFCIFSNSIAPKYGVNILDDSLLKEGTLIGFPSMYNKTEFTESDKKTVLDSIEYLKINGYLEDGKSFGTGVHQLATSSFIIGNWYKIFARSTGGIEISEM